MSVDSARDAAADRSRPAPPGAPPPRPGPRSDGHPGATASGDVSAADVPVQLLAPDGERRPHPRYGVDDLDGDDLRGFYRDMLLVRRFDEEATALQRQGELGLWASLRGQEAAQVGSARALAPGDRAFPTYREHGLALCRGVDPLAITALFRGVDNGAWDPARHGIALYSIVIGTQTLHAAGWALGARLDGSPDVALACFGDGATSEGDVHEAFVWAATHQLPVVFLCQNNQWAISEPVRQQARVPLYRRAAGYGFEGVRVDGNDVLAVHAVARDAVERARAGGGPTLVEAFTYRMGPHTTSDDPTRYRSAEEVEQWQERDPLRRLRTHLVRHGLVDDRWLADLDAEADALAERVRSGTRAMRDPAPESMFDHVLAELPRGLREQREQFLAYAASFVDAPERG